MTKGQDSRIYDTVIVGGGIAGLTVGYRLRDRDILLLEKEEVCGGRTISRKLGPYVYNAGAQVITGAEGPVGRLADELGVRKTIIAKTKTPMYIKGRLVASSHESAFLWKLPISLRDKIRLGLTVLRLRRRFGKITKQLPSLDDPRLVKLSSMTLAKAARASSPDLKAIWDALAMGSTTVLSEEVMAYHPLSSFLSLMKDEYYVEGGTWELTKALWKHIEDKTETSAEVGEITQQEGIVQVVYHRDGEKKTVRARRCAVAVPGPLVPPMMGGLPSWKRDALSKVDYGSFTTAAFLLSRPSEGFLPEGVWRMPVVGKRICSITDPTFTFPKEVKEESGQGLLRVYAGGTEARELQEMSDGEVMEAMAEELMAVLPEVRGKVITGSIKHWKHAVSPWRAGRLQLVPALQAPTGNIHYCGDYTDGSGMDGAVQSAHRVLREMQSSQG